MEGVVVEGVVDGQLAGELWAVGCRLLLGGVEGVEADAFLGGDLLPELTGYLDDLLRTRERLAAAVPRRPRTSSCASYAMRSPYSAEPTRGLAWTGRTEPCSPR